MSDIKSPVPTEHYREPVKAELVANGFRNATFIPPLFMDASVSTITHRDAGAIEFRFCGLRDTNILITIRGTLATRRSITRSSENLQRP